MTAEVLKCVIVPYRLQRTINKHKKLVSACNCRRSIIQQVQKPCGVSSRMKTVGICENNQSIFDKPFYDYTERISTREQYLIIVSDITRNNSIIAEAVSLYH